MLKRVVFVAAMLAATAQSVAACELVLSGHRDGAERLRVALPLGAPNFEIRFIHSVLGTAVVDRYEVREPGRMHLVEEQFSGDGYGLPAAAASGETLIQDGELKRLRLDRLVHPLVVRPLRAQHMQLRVGERTWLLADLSASTAAIELSAHACR